MASLDITTLIQIVELVLYIYFVNWIYLTWYRFKMRYTLTATLRVYVCLRMINMYFLCCRESLETSASSTRPSSRPTITHTLQQNIQTKRERST